MQDSELTKRETFLKNTLSKELDIEIIKDEKTILEKYSLNNEIYLNTYNCNALQGKFEEYEYCICEYYYTVGKSNQKRWMVSSSVRLPDKDFPEFELVLKSALLRRSITTSILLIPVVIIFLILFLFFLLSIYAMLYNFGDTITKISNDPSQILAFIMMQIPMLITFYIASYFFKAVKTIYNIKFSKNNFGINNQEFLNKYYISESKDENAIRRVFTSEICEKILKFKPELLGISSHGNCILSRSEGKINSVSICKKILNNIISQAKIFKQEDTL